MMRKLLAEFFGTFWLVFGGCGSAVLAAAFPNVRTRNYPLEPGQLFGIVDKLVAKVPLGHTGNPTDTSANQTDAFGKFAVQINSGAFQSNGR